jgi:POT family proton-dependent oligopeptide transporter
MRKAVMLGGILLVLGHFGMAFEGHEAQRVNGEIVRDDGALHIFYLSLALIIVGVGFLKPNISTIVGNLYPENDPRRESGFTLFYAGINLGAFIASLVCGWLGETYGWKYGFGAAGIGMVLGLITFALGQKYLHGHAEPKDPAKLKQVRLAGLTTEHLIYLGSFGAVAIVWVLIQLHSFIVPWLGFSPVLASMHVVTAALTIGIVWFMIKHCTALQRRQMMMVIFFIFSSLVLYTLYEQTYGSWVLFSDRVMNRDAFGVTWSAGQLTALGALFIFALSPVFAWLWPALEKRSLNPSMPAKSGLGIIIAGLSFWCLSYSATHPESNGLAGFWWFVLAYFVLEIGELLVAPIGLAAVSALSVRSVLSLMMGAWFLGTSYSEVLAAQLGKLSSITIEEGGTLNIGEALAKYAQLFDMLLWWGVGIGLAILVATPLLKRGMRTT